MKPVTWSRASVSVNDLSLDQSVMLVFSVQVIWMPAICWAAAKVSELWPGADVESVHYFLFPWRTYQKGLGAMWRI